jgi:hypothetical protein
MGANCENLNYQEDMFFDRAPCSHQVIYFVQYYKPITWLLARRILGDLIINCFVVEYLFSFFLFSYIPYFQLKLSSLPSEIMP